MTLEQMKKHAKALTPDDRGALFKFLQGLTVTEDPEWQQVMREAAERRELAAQSRKAGATQSTKPRAKSA